jgi:hypothetical protein
VEPHHLWLRSGDNRHSLRHEIGRAESDPYCRETGASGFHQGASGRLIGSGLAACVIGAAIYDAGRVFLP